MEIAVSIDFAEAYYITNGAFLLLFISICLQHLAFGKIFRHSVYNRSDKDQNDVKFLRDLIQFHITAKK